EAPLEPRLDRGEPRAQLVELRPLERAARVVAVDEHAAQEVERQEIQVAPLLLEEDELADDALVEFLAGLGVDALHVLPGGEELADVVERDGARAARVVEAAVAV